MLKFAIIPVVVLMTADATIATTSPLLNENSSRIAIGGDRADQVGQEATLMAGCPWGCDGFGGVGSPVGGGYGMMPLPMNGGYSNPAPAGWGSYGNGMLPLMGGGYSNPTSPPWYPTNGIPIAPIGGGYTSGMPSLWHPYNGVPMAPMGGGGYNNVMPSLWRW